MKKKLILIAAALFLAGFVFTSCKKDDPVNNNTITIRYEFSSDKDANYVLRYKPDSIEIDETIAGRTWTKTVSVNKNSTSTTSLTAFAPADWFDTPNEANATVKIFINGNERASNSGVLVGLDHPAGLSVSTGIE